MTLRSPAGYARKESGDTYYAAKIVLVNRAAANSAVERNIASVGASMLLLFLISAGFLFIILQFYHKLTYTEEF
jgi:hypothetical protein